MCWTADKGRTLLSVGYRGAVAIAHRFAVLVEDGDGRGGGVEGKEGGKMPCQVGGAVSVWGLRGGGGGGGRGGAPSPFVHRCVVSGRVKRGNGARRAP